MYEIFILAGKSLVKWSAWWEIPYRNNLTRFLFCLHVSCFIKVHTYGLTDKKGSGLMKNWLLQPFDEIFDGPARVVLWMPVTLRNNFCDTYRFITWYSFFFQGGSHSFSESPRCKGFILVNNCLVFPRKLNLSRCFIDYLNYRCHSGEILSRLLARKVCLEIEDQGI